MPELSRRLLDLQALDVEIERLARQIQQTDAALADELKIHAADLANRQAEQTLHQRQAEQKELEFELASLEQRIKTHEQHLYSGRGGPRELESLRRDIEHDQERRGQLEEKVLVAMEATEAARVERERIREATARVLDELAAQRQRLGAEREQLLADRTQRQVQRAQLAASIDAPALALYERLRQRMPDGIAVAEVIQSHCEGCRTSLPSAEIQRARRTEGAVQCSECQRILHVPLG